MSSFVLYLSKFFKFIKDTLFSASSFELTLLVQKYYLACQTILSLLVAACSKKNITCSISLVESKKKDKGPRTIKKMVLCCYI